MRVDQNTGNQNQVAAKGLKFLSPRQVRMIDDLLQSIGDFGEVHLEVRNGKLRFASRTESIDALKYEDSR